MNWINSSHSDTGDPPPSGAETQPQCGTYMPCATTTTRPGFSDVCDTLRFMCNTTPPAPCPHEESKSLVRLNAEKDATYNPYCMRCPGLVRMSRKAPFFWRCKCGAIHDERTLVEVLDQAAAVAAQGNWIPANGGTEVPFITRNRRRLLYCWQPSTGKHAYLDCNTDIILSDEEARLALGTW